MDMSAPVVHSLFEALAFVVGFALHQRDRARRGDFLSKVDRWTLVVAAILGAGLGSKVLHHLANPTNLITYGSDPSYYLVGGKTIVGGLLGGWLAVELAKKRLGIRRRTGDAYVIPLIAAIAVGRLGCFFAGLPDDTCGVPTDVPWAVDFGDGIPRHPVQLYEIAFALFLGFVLGRPVEVREGDRFRAFIYSYLLFRLVVDFLKPYENILGLGVLQWVALLVLIGGRRELPRLLRTFA